MALTNRNAITVFALTPSPIGATGVSEASVSGTEGRERYLLSAR
ncbi:hypothetical protein SOASR031_18450 [Leminorella grimontii]|nr:hypothetical protein SOASR031_18450 [Leminorella grimontii]